MRMLKVLCAIDGEREPFFVDVNDSDSSTDLKNKVKLVRPGRLLQDANTLSLYKAPEGVGFNTEPGVTVSAKDKIHATGSLRGMFAETNTVQVIVRPPGYERSPLNAVQYDSRSGDLVWKQDAFKNFPFNGVSSFKKLRQCADFCFFDKTAFIMALESFGGPALVFLRPRRSGKSLGLSTLAHFHGREHLPDYKPLFEGLAIDESIKKFYRTYEPYLRMSAHYLIENFIKDNAVASQSECVGVVHNILSSVKSPEDPLSKIKGIYLMADGYDSYSNEYLVPNDSILWKPPRGAEPDGLLKGFWAAVKTGLGSAISKCYITGVSPQSLDDNTSGFNVARYVSWESKLAGFCGLTEADVAAALALENVCGSTAKEKKHLKIMKDHYNGFNFVPGGRGPLIYNTNTCLEYLQRLAEGNPMKNPLSVTNSEASEVSLRLLAASPVATKLLEDGLFSESKQGKKAGELAKSKAAWLSYMVHLGGLTFCIRKKALRIPNLLVAERLGSAILHRHDASLEDVDGAFRSLIEDGYIDRIVG
ncbi:hypothetical protein BGZ67_001771 [Mortierella alpina]|nr:hypothetical protein BGZ67_001771 [Mortierella alpina]